MVSGSLLALVARVHSFRRNTPHQSGSAASEAGDVWGSFHSDLAQRVGQLQLQGGSAHLNWLLDACACALSTHASLASALNIHSSADAHAPAVLLNPHRADEMLSMLDTCTSLKQVADDVDRQLILLQAALQSSRQAFRVGTSRLAAARRLRACLDGLQALSSAQYKPIKDAQAALLRAAKREVMAPAASRDSAAPPLNHALHGTLLISLLVLVFTMANLAAPSRSSSGALRSACKLVASSCKSVSSMSTVTTWSGPLRQLQHDLKQEEMSALFLELQGLHAAAASILAAVSGPPHHQINAADLRQRIDSVDKRSQEAQACVAALRSQLASLFQALVALRLSLLSLH